MRCWALQGAATHANIEKPETSFHLRPPSELRTAPHRTETQVPPQQQQQLLAPRGRKQQCNTVQRPQAPPAAVLFNESKEKWWMGAPTRRGPPSFNLDRRDSQEEEGAEGELRRPA